jgi:putative hydrolase
MLKTDLHTHTVASGHAMNTAYEMIQSAREKGLELLALTDHGPKTVGGPVEGYFFIASLFPRRFGEVEVLMGCEANIMDGEGRLDLPERYLKRLDIVIAGLHREAGWVETSREKNTQAMIAAMKNPYVDVISHPYSIRCEADMGQLVAASYEHGVPLEVNCLHLSHYERGGFDVQAVREMIQHVRDYHWKLVISSDAHMASMIGDDAVIDRLHLRKLLSPKIVLNTSRAAVQTFLTGKREKRGS